MASVLDTIQSLSVDAAVVPNLQAALTDVAGRTTAVPTHDIQRLVDLAQQIVLPDEQGLFGNGAQALTALVHSGLRAPDEIWSAVTAPLSGLETALTSGLQAPMQQVFDGLRHVGDAAAADPSSLLGALSGPLQQAAAVLGQGQELQRVKAFMTTLNNIGTQLAAAPAQLAALIQEQIEAALGEATSLVAPVLQHLERFIGSVHDTLRSEELESRYQAMLLRLVPEAGPSVAASLAALDLASDVAVAPIDAQLRAARALAQNLAVDAENRLAQAATLLPAFDVEAWGQRLAAAATLAASGEVSTLTNLLERWQQGLQEAEHFVADLSMEQVLQPLREMTERLQPALDGLNLDAVKTQLLQGVQAATSLANTITQAQIDVLAAVQSLANSIAEAINGIDLSVVTTTVENALASLDTVVADIEGGLDTVSAQMQGLLADLQLELETLHTKLTDPAGEFRQPLEQFFNTIAQAIPDNIPETLEQVGAEIAEVVSSLDDLTFDPTFDAVVDELEQMRQTLSEVDYGSLNPILQGTLTAALAVFKAFDFPGEVEDVLTATFNDAVDAVDQSVIQTLQDQVDGIVTVAREHDPAVLFDKLGITQVYEEMVTALDGFRPSAALQEVLDTIQAALEQIEAFTPSAVLDPVMAPLNQLKEFMQGLSLEPVMAQLQQALGQITGLVAQVDMQAFIDESAAAINRLRQQLNDILTTAGLLDFLRPLHTAVMEGLDAIDPAVLLQPLTAVRQTLLDAIEAVETSALTDAFSGVAATVERFRLPSLRTDFAGKLQELTGSVNHFDLPAKITQLQTAQQEMQAALEGLGEQADAVAEDRRQMMLTTVNALEPLPLYAGAMERYRTLQTSLTRLGATVDTLLSDSSSLNQPLAALSERLREIAPPVAEGVSDLKQFLRQAVTQAFEALGTDEITQLYAQVQATFASYSPDNLSDALNALLAPVRAFVDSLLDPANVFSEVRDAFNTLQALIDPGLGNFLGQLQTQVQPLLDAITATVAALDPSAVLALLDAKYADLVALQDRLQAKLQELLSNLDAPYEQMVQLLDDLNPGVVLAEPLSAAYQAILDKVEGIDVRAVFQPVIEAFETLRDELIAGIKRTATAFESFLAAAPSGGGPSAALAL